MPNARHTVRLPFRAAVLLLAAWVAATALPAAAQPAGDQDEQDYVIGPLDQLDIRVFGQGNLSGSYTVGTDSSISFPLIGRVDAGGRTAQALEELLRERFAAGFLRDPRVNVTVMAYRSRRVFVLGQVRSPGAYPLAVPTTVIELLALAGGSTELAAAEVVVVRGGALPAEALESRELPEDLPPPQEGDGSEALRVDLAAIERGDVSQNVTLQNGDTVFVPRAAVVYVFGEVRGPGRYVLRGATTVLQALTLAGGTTPFAALNRMRIVRTVNGEQVDMPAELNDPVQPDDTIRVPERFF